MEIRKKAHETLQLISEKVLGPRSIDTKKTISQENASKRLELLPGKSYFYNFQHQNVNKKCYDIVMNNIGVMFPVQGTLTKFGTSIVTFGAPCATGLRICSSCPANNSVWYMYLAL